VPLDDSDVRNIGGRLVRLAGAIGIGILGYIALDAIQPMDHYFHWGMDGMNPFLSVLEALVLAIWSYALLGILARSLTRLAFAARVPRAWVVTAPPRASSWVHAAPMHSNARSMNQ
jgi:hypothetical protein